MAKRELLLGDEALALGALHAGLSGVYAYPGTPSTEITEYIHSKNLDYRWIPYYGAFGHADWKK